MQDLITKDNVTIRVEAAVFYRVIDPVKAVVATLTLRTLQTLAEVATEHNSTCVLPIPIDVLEAVRHANEAAAAVGNGRQLDPNRPVAA